MPNGQAPQDGNKKVVLRKIPLFDLLKLMEHLYDTGANYVDIIGISMGEDVQDEIMVAVKDEYMNNKETEDEIEEEDNVEDMEGVANIISEEKPKKSKITDEDINDLLEIL